MIVAAAAVFIPFKCDSSKIQPQTLLSTAKELKALAPFPPSKSCTIVVQKNNLSTQ